MSAREWTVTIPAPGAWLNANGRRDRRYLVSTIKAWRDAAHVHARAAKLPKLARVHIVAHLRFTDRRARDVHNYFPTIKAVVDGLVDHGLIPDDRDEHLLGPDLRTGVPLRRTVFAPVGEVVLTITEATDA